MRELSFSALTSEDKRRRLLALSESTQLGKWTVQIERKSSYFIREEVAKEDEITLKRWIVSHWHQQPEQVKKNSVILKEIDKRSRIARYLHKSHGILYALGKGKAYTVGFVHVYRAHYVKTDTHSPAYEK